MSDERTDDDAIARRHERRRRHRRVVAAPTNPEADPADDAPGTAATRPPDAADGRSHDPRDAWIRDQRPPHWD